MDTRQAESLFNRLARQLDGLPAAARGEAQADLDHLREMLMHQAQYLESQSQLQRQQQRIEQDLNECEKRFQALADSSPLLIWMTGTQGENLFVNRTYREFIGVSAEGAGGFNWHTFFHPDAREPYIAAFEKAVRDQAVFNQETCVRHADGSWRWVVCYAEPRFSTDGSFLGHLGHTTDITGYRKAEQALEQSRDDLKRETNRLMAVLEAMPVGVSLVDRGGGLLLANRGFDQVWGEPRPDPASVEDYAQFLAWDAATGEPIQPEDWASARAVLKDETVTGQFLEIQRFDGQRAFVMNSAAPIHDEDGQVTGSAVVIMDITEKVKAERALHDSENALRIALENSPVNVFTQDCDLRYTWVFRSGFGLDPAFYLGKRDEDLPNFTEIEALVAAKRQVIETGQGLRQEVRFRFRGKETYVLLSLEPLISARGLRVGLRGSAIDITELRTLQESQREHLSQLEIHHRLMEQREKDRQVIARDIHDGPVQTLSSVLFQLQYARGSLSDPLLQADLEKISADVRTAVQELRQVIFELRPPSVIRFGLARAIRYHIEDLRAKNPEIRFQLRLADDSHKLSEVLVLTLYRIYQEAITNIIRHAEATQVWVRLQLYENALLLEIRDNGKGLPQGYNPRSLTERGHFGLAGIKERVDAINGELKISSPPGKGTSLQIRAPFRETE